MKYRYLCLVLFVLLASVDCRAQYSYQQLDNSHGLSNSCINSIYQDSDNLVWLGTWDGLNFFDGNDIHVFNYELAAANKNSIASNVIYQVTEDHSRNIWVGTVEGVSKFNKNTGDFSNYFYSRKKAVSNGYITAISPDGSVYAARRSSPQLYRYNALTDKFTAVSIKDLVNFMTIKIFFDDRGDLWLLKDNGILEAFTARQGNFVKLKGYTPVDNVDDAFICNHQVFYLTKANQLYRIGADNRKTLLTTLPHEVRSAGFFNGHYLFAWASKGLGEYDGNFKPVAGLQQQIPVLQNVRVTSLLSGRDNLLWIGTDGNGVIKVTRKENYFGIVKQQASGQPFSIPVRAFCEVNNELWIGTKGNGIITLKNWDKNNVSYASINTFRTNVDLLDNCVYAIVKGGDGLIYIGSDAAGVTVYDQQSGKFIKWNDIGGSGQYPYFGSVHCILYDTDGSVWLGLNDAGLVHLKLTFDADGHVSIAYFKQYKYNYDDKGPANNVIYSLVEGSDNKIWIGCRYGGLSMFDKKSGRFTTLKAFSYEGSLSNNDVLSLYIDHKNRLWAGTSFGLNWVDETDAARGLKPVFKKLYIDDGLPNNTIHAITEDNAGNLWVSTNKGLAKINPASLNIVQYKASDGLQSDEFSDNAVWKNPAGMLFFGGIYGFNYFLPANIHIHNELPRLLLTDLHFAGKNTAEKALYILTKKGAIAGRRFTMSPGNGYFELTIQPVSYQDAQKCQYAYMLQGNDKGWHYMANSNKIIYNNLSPGTYTLKIKWSNGEGAWTNGIAAFTLTVQQYFWLTPLAYILYTLILAYAGFVYLRYRKNKFLLAQELKMEHALRYKDEQLHQERLNFFTNIAHELQTPLTLILGSVERYLFKTKHGKQPDDKGRHFLSIVKQETSRLNHLVNQLLEFRKAETGHLHNHYSHIDVSELLTNIASLFTALVDEKKLDFSWQIEPGISVWTDRDKLEKIVFNLLSNAFKYTTEKQYIIFSTNALKTEGRLEIIVANSGCKLKDEDMAQLFERFFVADGKDSMKSSTGIGLAFARQLVTLLGGDISAKCENEWISFKTLLPLHFVPGENDTVIEQNEKGEYATLLADTMTAMPDGITLAATAESNKKALINSIDNGDKKSVLVVEDDPLIRYLLRDILSETYIIYEAGTGLEALEVMKRSVPNLIISDIMMPDMDGLQLCSLVKNTAETCHIPFVLLSARTAAVHQTQGYSCGADAYIPKPFQAEHLLVRIAKLLEYREKLHKAFTANAGVVSVIGGQGLSENDKTFIEKITKVIEDNLDAELDSAFLEKALNMGRMQLYRKIKTFSDMTPTELIRHIRLQKATILLLNSDLTVSEIVYRTGFNNKSFFFREFKKIYNCPPNDYRARHRLPGEIKS